jgi:cell division protein FtsL
MKVELIILVSCVVIFIVFSFKIAYDYKKNIRKLNEKYKRECERINELERTMFDE